MPEQQPLAKILVTAAEAARLLSIGESTLWRLARAGKLPNPVKIGGATRWRAEALQNIGAMPTAKPATCEALDAQRIKEAKTSGEAVRKKRYLENIHQAASCSRQAEELRRLAATVIAHMDPAAPADVRLRAHEWRECVLKLADELDPIAKILANFSVPQFSLEPASYDAGIETVAREEE